jgi:diguanylate cyclase (GGDEF)-like protein
MTAFGSAMIVVNVILAALLFSKGGIRGRGDATRLGTAYLFVAAVFVPLVACFPDGLVKGSIIGTPESAIWLWSAWHGGFGIYMIRYAWSARRQSADKVSLPLSLIEVAAVVSTLAVVSTTFVRYLPSTFSDGHTLFSGTSGFIPVTILLIFCLALLLTLRSRTRDPEQLWIAVALVAAIFDVWLTLQGSSRFSVGWYLSKCGSLLTSLIVLMSLLHEVTMLHSRADEANLLLSGLANKDGLTGLYNRRRFDELLKSEWARSRRERQPLSLLMIDVDHFKKFNDHYGHPAGDECLREVAAALKTAVGRPGDAAARYGGEEFVLLLPSTPENGARKVAHRVQVAIEQLAVAHAGSPMGRLSLSIGLATMVAGSVSAAEDLVAEADRHVYRAKKFGRDQVCSSDDALPSDEKSYVNFDQRMIPSAVS